MVFADLEHAGFLILVVGLNLGERYGLEFECWVNVAWERWIVLRIEFSDVGSLFGSLTVVAVDAIDFI